MFKVGDLSYGTTNDEGEFVVLTKEQLDAAKVSALPKNVMNLTVHDAAQVAEKIVPTKKGGSYVFYPDVDDPANVQWNDLLIELLQRDQKALVGFLNLQNFEGLFRLTVFRGRIVVQKQAYPEEVNPHEDYDAEVDEDAANKAAVLLDKLTADFDAENYTNNIKEQVKAVVETVIEGGEATVIESPVTDSFDILSALDGFEV